jgi:hypothetical protein
MKKITCAIGVAAWMAMPMPALSTDQSIANERGNRPQNPSRVPGGGKPLATGLVGEGSVAANMRDNAAGLPAVPASDAEMARSGADRQVLKFNPPANEQDAR